MDRSIFSRVVVVANRKGGVGKTSIVANLAWNTVAAGLGRVLLIDLDSQAHISLEFGCRDKVGFDKTGEWDAGRQLREALTTGVALQPVRDIRPHLDLVTADPTFYDDEPRRAVEPWHMLVEPLAAIAHNYDLIVIDTPPTSWPMTQMAFGVARYVVFPFRPEPSSLEGIPRTYSNILDAQQVNPDLQILRFVMTLTGSQSTRMHREAFELLSKLGVDRNAISPQVVPFLERASNYGRSKGLLPAEALVADTGKPWFDYVKAGEQVPAPAGPGGAGVARLAEVYGRLSAEILTAISAQEDADQEEPDDRA